MITILGKKFVTYNFNDIKHKYFGFIYVTINNTNGRMYVGMHYRWDKNYLGSGVILKNAIKREGVSNFTRHIIDVAETYDILVELELLYLTQYFGLNCADSPLFYNLSDKAHKKGSMSWAYLTPEERTDRANRAKATLQVTLAKRTPEQKKALSKKFSKIAKSNYEKNPELRKLISERTIKGMTPKVKEHLSKVKTGVSPNISETERKSRADRMRVIGKRKTVPWNKGVTTKELVGEAMSLAKRKHYRVLLNGVEIIEDVANVGGYQSIADTISVYFGGKPVGRNNVQTLILTKDCYHAKVPQKQFMEGLQILQKEGNEKRTND